METLRYKVSDLLLCGSMKLHFCPRLGLFKTLIAPGSTAKVNFRSLSEKTDSEQF